MAQDPAADRLKRAPIPDRVRADAWDAFMQATDPDDLARRLTPLAMPDAVKADLWDLKAGQPIAAPTPTATPPRAPGLATLGEIAAEKPGGLGTFVSRVAGRVNPIAAAQSLGRMVIPEAAARALGAGDKEAEQYGPLNTLRNMGQATQGVFEEAKAAYDRGDYGSAAIKTLFGSIPLVGPDLNQMGNAMREGRTAEALGDAVGLGASLVAPQVVGTVSARVGKMLPAAQTPAEAAAVRFGRERGIPVDAATATGSDFVRSMQGAVDYSPLGAPVAARARAVQGRELARVGKELSAEVQPAPISAVGAGERVSKALANKITQHNVEATTAYERLRQFEAAAPAEAVATGRTTTTHVPTAAVDAAGRPVMQSATVPASASMRLAVDLRPARQALQPIYDRLTREAELVPLQGGKARALTALDRLMGGRSGAGHGRTATPPSDYAPLSVVDEALGDLKALARTDDLPALRTQGQGVAAQAVKQLDAQVRARAAQAGPDVLNALEEGRRATVAKYATAEARDLIAGRAGAMEPRTIFNRLTANEDAGLVKLRQLERLTPAEVPNVARGLLEDILERPTAEGGFQGAAKAKADWSRVGAATKRILYPKPGQVEAIDNFFNLAAKIAESPNPSKSGLLANAVTQSGLVVLHPATGIPVVLGTGALATILHSPKAVQFLTTGLRMSINAKPAAQAAAAAQLGRAAQEAGVLRAVPAAAEVEASRERRR